MKRWAAGILAVGFFVGTWGAWDGIARSQAPAQGGGGASEGRSHRPPVAKVEYERWKTELSNWGRWGKDDEIGALNLITPAKRRQAAALVRDGMTVSLAGDVNTVKAEDNFAPYEHVMTQAGPTGAADRLAVSYHGYAHTHIDGFAHRFFDGKMWNGFSHEEVTKDEGAKKNSIQGRASTRPIWKRGRKQRASKCRRATRSSSEPVAGPDARSSGPGTPRARPPASTRR